jgi:hypothetical protein
MKTIATIALIVEAICVLTAIVWITKELIQRNKEKKDKLKKQREELLCEYSGLPSVKAYEN